MSAPELEECAVAVLRLLCEWEVVKGWYMQAKYQSGIGRFNIRPVYTTVCLTEANLMTNFC